MMEANPNRVWAVIDRDHHDYILAVYPTEIEALRVVNLRGGRAESLEWGCNVDGEVVS